MGDLQKSNNGGLILAIVLGLIVVFVMVQIKGGRDGCEASGRQTQGLVECVESSPSSAP